jgi:hypothetical protein
VAGLAWEALSVSFIVSRLGEETPTPLWFEIVVTVGLVIQIVLFYAIMVEAGGC